MVEGKVGRSIIETKVSNSVFAQNEGYYFGVYILGKTDQTVKLLKIMLET